MAEIGKLNQVKGVKNLLCVNNNNVCILLVVWFKNKYT